MDTLLKIANMVLLTLGSMLFNVLFWILILLVLLLYKRSASIENTMLGEQLSLKEKLIGSVLNGIVGGVAGSFLAIFLGITIREYIPASNISSSGLMYIWIIAILLAMVNPRYLCFSYAGGIVALVHLLTGFPEINVPGILALIGILHFIESFLIWLDGHSHSTPVFIKRNGGNIVGGFVMNRIWPIPLVVLTATVQSVIGDGAVNMPDWWPIIKHTGSLISSANLAYVLEPVPVVLGYADMAITNTPERRCKDSALKLAGYSIILIALAALSSRIYAFQYIAALFAPIGHEMLILWGKKSEESGKPFFAPSDSGLKVLYCLKNTPAYSMKLEPGDIILNVNNKAIENEVALADFLKTRPPFVWLDVIKADGTRVTAEYKDYQKGVGSLGALVIPKNSAVYFELNEGESPLRRIAGYIKNRIVK